MSISGDIMSTSGRFSTLGDIMMHVGKQVDKSLPISIENPDVLKSPDVLMTSPDVLIVSPHIHHDISRCTEHPPTPMYS